MPQTKEERKRSIAEHSRRWQKKNLKKVIVCFNVGTNEKDRKVYEFLKSQGSPSAFLKWLAEDECEALKEAEETSQSIKWGKGRTYSLDEAEAMIGDTAMEEHEKTLTPSAGKTSKKSSKARRKRLDDSSPVH